MSISSCMTSSVITATSDQTIRDVCKIMCERKIGSIIILKDTTSETDKNTQYNNPIGITTERDVVTHLGSNKSSSLQTPVFEIMSHPLVTIQPNSSLRDAIETMQLKNNRRLPVISKENDSERRMVGIVTEKDIFRAIMKTLPSPQNNAEGLISDQMQFGYRFMYERFINEDYFAKDTHPSIG
jgi:CBS domain-containing protein